MVSAILAPYCQDVPVVFAGEPGAFLQAAGGDAAGLATSDPVHRDFALIHIARYYEDQAQADESDPWLTHLALHECAHVVVAHALGESVHDELAVAYPEIDVFLRIEAVADALTQHWAAANPGANTSRYFVPRYDDGLTVLESGMGPYQVQFDVLDVAGDDALLDRLTAAAMARGAARATPAGVARVPREVRRPPRR